MGYSQSSAGYAPRQPLHLAIPPTDVLLGLRPTTARVRADRDIEAVEIAFADVELLLSPPATIALVVRLIDALGELEGLS